MELAAKVVEITIGKLRSLRIRKSSAKAELLSNSTPSSVFLDTKGCKLTSKLVTHIEPSLFKNLNSGSSDQLSTFLFLQDHSYHNIDHNFIICILNSECILYSPLLCEYLPRILGSKFFKSSLSG